VTGDRPGVGRGERMLSDVDSTFATQPHRSLYVAYLDILGFSNRILCDFELALETYEELLTTLNIFQAARPAAVELHIASDSLVAVGEQLTPLLDFTSHLQWATLLTNSLVRGGVAFGRHVEEQGDRGFQIVSEALVRAVRTEQSVRYPCVALHDSVQPGPEHFGSPRQPNLERLVLFYQGRWIVNPFTIAWGTSARDRATFLAEEFPDYAQTYRWFIDLHRAVFSASPLLPGTD